MAGAKTHLGFYNNIVGYWFGLVKWRPNQAFPAYPYGFKALFPGSIPVLVGNPGPMVPDLYFMLL
jgi:hypothetical protein